MINQTESQSNIETYIHRFHSGDYTMLNGNGTEVDFDGVIHFEQGIPGFEFLSQFLIVPLKEYPPFRILQSLEAPEIAMLVLPSQFMELGDELDVKTEDLEKIRAKSKNDFETHVILKVSGEEGQFTANTKAPVIINPHAKLGAQVILDHPALNIHHLLELT